MININFIKRLKNGEALILPTDTLYGLASLAYDYVAVKNVFDIKKRDYEKQLPVHYHSIELIEKDCIIDDEIKEIMKKYWPGGLTIILKKHNYSKLQFVKDTVAVRIPNNKILLSILKELNEPLVMPSANISNHEPALKFLDVQKELNIDGIEDDKNILGIPSTIISYLDGNLKILRKGAINI